MDAVVYFSYLNRWCVILIKLSPRLKACAENVTSGCKIADIGTDHAYLPIYLASKNKISYALACDINEGPLIKAKDNICKYGMENIIETRLSDGLKQVNINEADEVIIAGMGGDLISRIIKASVWFKNQSKVFILQPMSSESSLREFLIENGYFIKRECAVISDSRVYTVMLVLYDGKHREYDDSYIYTGNLFENITPETCEYIKKQLRDLDNRLKGARALNNRDLELYYSKVINTIEGYLSKF